MDEREARARGTPSFVSKEADLRPMAGGRYRDYRVVGEGGMGIVYWALDTDLSREVALKVVRPSPEESDGTPTTPFGLSPPADDERAADAFRSLKARFLQEAWVTAGLEHPGIVPVYELGVTAEGVPYYTMRFVRGRRTLATAIDEAKGRDVEERLALLEPFLRVCDTVRYAHARGVLHRDLKPENVAIGEFGEVVVLDWGLAKVGPATASPHDIWQARAHVLRARTGGGTVAVGTPGYMAPEALRGSGADVDERSDVYSLGAVLHRILTGRLPFAFDSISTLVPLLLASEPRDPRLENPDVPEGLSRLCLRALAREPAARTATVEALAAGIRAWMHQRSVDRRADEALRDVAAFLAGAEQGSGEVRLRQLDRAALACEQARALRPDDPRVATAAARIDALRRLGIEERMRQARRRVVRRVVGVGLAVSTVAAALVAFALETRRKQAESAEQRATAERDAKSAALRRARAVGLAHASASVLAEDPLLALLLAREATRIEELPSAVTQLHAALAAPTPVALLEGHDAGVVHLAFSPAGDRLLTSSTDGTARIWDSAGRETGRCVGHSGPVRQAEFLPSGERLVTASDDGTLRLWTADGGFVRELVRHDRAVTSFAVEPRGERVACASADGTASVVPLGEGETVFLRGHTGGLTSVAFAPDGSRVVTASKDGTARVWSRSGEGLAVLSGHRGTVNAAAFSPTGEHVATAGDDATARVFEATGRLARTLEGHAGRVTAVRFSPRGDLLLTASEDRRAVVWGLDGRPVKTLGPFEHGVTAAAFSPAGDAVLTAAAWAPSVQVTPLDGSSAVRFGGHRNRVACAEFGPDGRFVATACEDGIARLWETVRRELPELRGHADVVWGASYSRQGDRIATASADGTARVWDLDGRERLAVRANSGTAVGFADFSPDGTRLVTAGEDRTARIWDLAGKELAVLRGHARGVRMARFTRDGRRVLTASWDGRARLFDLDGSLVATVGRPSPGISWAAISPTGDRIATAEMDGRAKLWDLSGRELKALRASGGRAWCVEFSPDGSLLLTGGEDGRAILHDLSGGPAVVLRADDLSCGAVFTSDGKRVVTKGTTGFVRVWTLAGDLEVSFRAHSRDVYGLDVDPSGRRIVTSAWEGVARQWLLRTEDVVRLADERRLREFTVSESARFAELLEPPHGDAAR